MPTDISPPHILTGQIVLIIEDDPIMLRNLVQWFQQAGCKVMAAHDGVEGMARFEQIRPNVVITDILMPNREGVETLMAMKARAPEVKVLAISGGGRLGSLDLLNMAHKLGADAVLAKPFRATDVVSIVGRLLQPGDQTT
ncbi:response regulator [Brevundimonas sp.]|uniref:response regulator n=1 Tax=Brevundimonas sp. TaxID=1871086 RepID=UPI002ED95834